jgi:hypothetical protein
MPLRRGSHRSGYAALASGRLLSWPAPSAPGRDAGRPGWAVTLGRHSAPPDFIQAAGVCGSPLNFGLR